MDSLVTTLASYKLQPSLTPRVEDLSHRLANLASQTKGTDTQLQEQVGKLASLFIYQVLQAMRRTVPESGLLKKGFANDLYFGFFDQEVANHIANRKELGLTSLLMHQFRGLDTPMPQMARDKGIDMYQQHGQRETLWLTPPLQGALTSPYGRRSDPIDRQAQFHHGIDIAAPIGTTVRSAGPGKVTFSGPQGSYGNLIIIDHQNGYQTYYAHNEKNLVAVGDDVARAQPIARVGDTGRTTGPHLHFEVRKDGRALDPTPMLGQLAHQARLASP